MRYRYTKTFPLDYIKFNESVSLYNVASGKFVTDELHRLAKLKFLYNCDYRTVVNDATSILSDYELYGQVNLMGLHCIDKKIEYLDNITLTEEEKNMPIIERDGQFYAVIGEHMLFYSGVLEKGWNLGK